MKPWSGIMSRSGSSGVSVTRPRSASRCGFPFLKFLPEADSGTRLPLPVFFPLVFPEKGPLPGSGFPWDGAGLPILFYIGIG